MTNTGPTFKPEIIAACNAYEAEEGGYDGMIAAINAFLRAQPNAAEDLAARVAQLEAMRGEYRNRLKKFGADDSSLDAAEQDAIARAAQTNNKQ